MAGKPSPGPVGMVKNDKIIGEGPKNPLQIPWVCGTITKYVS